MLSESLTPLHSTAPMRTPASIKSLYTVIPNNGGLQALSHFFDQRANKEPPTHTLARLAELVLTLNAFSFNGEYYRQIGDVAMGINGDKLQTSVYYKETDTRNYLHYSSSTTQDLL